MLRGRGAGEVGKGRAEYLADWDSCSRRSNTQAFETK